MLRWAYTLWSPFYDLVVASAFRDSRRKSLAALGRVDGQRILLAGIGTGLDVPWLDPMARYVGLDLTPAMLARARSASAARGLTMTFQIGDVMALPYRSESFDHVIMHLILAVAPNPGAALVEATRVLKPGGTIRILDKFLAPGQRAPIRRRLSPLLGRVATRTDVVFESVLASCSGLELISNEPDIAAGWFRRIVLRRSF